MKSDVYLEFMKPFDWFEVLGLFLFFIGLGLVFSIISQMGFFAYLTVNQLGLSFFRTFWPWLQVAVVVVVLFDLVYFRYSIVENSSVMPYVFASIFLLIYSLIIARIKANQTNKKAFIPALFFMVVVTFIEWVPGLRTSGGDYAWLMIVPLLLCNTYQLLILHRLTEKKQA